MKGSGKTRYTPLDTSVGLAMSSCRLLFGLFAGATGFQQLKFLGDWQSGAWDTDAAENVAYDKSTNRAFIASAESRALKVPCSS